MTMIIEMSHILILVYIQGYGIGSVKIKMIIEMSHILISVYIQ